MNVNDKVIVINKESSLFKGEGYVIGFENKNRYYPIINFYDEETLVMIACDVVVIDNYDKNNPYRVIILTNDPFYHSKKGTIIYRGDKVTVKLDNGDENTFYLNEVIELYEENHSNLYVEKDMKEPLCNHSDINNNTVSEIKKLMDYAKNSDIMIMIFDDVFQISEDDGDTEINFKNVDNAIEYLKERQESNKRLKRIVEKDHEQQ